MKQKELSIWLRAIVVIGFLCVAFLGAVVVPNTGHSLIGSNPQFAFLYTPFHIFIWISAAPVFLCLILVWLMAVEIGRDNSFCLKNAARLKMCSFLSIFDTILYVAGAIALGLMGALPPVILIMIAGLAAVGAAIAVCCAALSHLTRKAAELKAENDLTV